MDAHAEESGSADPHDEALEMTTPSDQRSGFKIGFGDSDHSDEGEDAGQHEHHHKAEASDRCNGQAHEQDLKRFEQDLKRALFQGFFIQ